MSHSLKVAAQLGYGAYYESPLYNVNPNKATEYDAFELGAIYSYVDPDEAAHDFYKKIGFVTKV